MQEKFYSSKISGSVRVPASKSLCHRALLCAALAGGESRIENVSLSVDVSATIGALTSLGIKAEYNESDRSVTVGGFVNPVNGITINCHESASLLRFIIPIAAALGIDATFIGEGRLPQRPLDFYRDMLRTSGVSASFPEEEGKYLPLTISGKLNSGIFEVPGNVTSQYITGLLLALPLLGTKSEIRIRGKLESKPYADMTVSLMKLYGVDVIETENGYIIPADSKYSAHDYSVEGDYSQAAFFAVAGAISGDATITGVGESSPQGDRAVAEILKRMGAYVSFDSGLSVKCAGRLRATTIDASDIPDLIPVLSVACALADGESHIINAARLRIKESDRLATTAAMLNAIGADVTELEDGLVIRGKEMFSGGLVDSANDHRIAMAAAVASLRCTNPVTVNDMSCINKSYPNFTRDFRLMTEDKPVYFKKCAGYDPDLLLCELRSAFEAIGVTRDLIYGKNVVIKPNLVRRMDAMRGGTTHPNMALAAVKLSYELGAKSVTLVESPGGPYNGAALRLVWRGCGFDEKLTEAGAAYNDDYSVVNLPYHEGAKTVNFNILKPITDADVIINLAKIKSHGLTKMTCCVKNFFGCIPGTEKVEMHARFPERADFASVLVDICNLVCKNKTVIHIADGIVAMEGNGPTNGTPRKLGYFLAGRDPFVIDTFICGLIGFEPDTVPLVNDAIQRGYSPGTPSDIRVIGDPFIDMRVGDFKAPDSDAAKLLKLLPNIMGGRLNRALQPKPKVIPEKCVGCGECVRSCPMKTIAITPNKKAKIDVSRCIRCYCCQELCPKDAVKIKKNILLKIVN